MKPNAIKKHVTRALSLVFAVMLLVAFQNCSPARFGTQQPMSDLKSEVENGTGYGGKIYLSTIPSWGTHCSDGTPVHGRFVTTSETSATLTRRNCVDIQPIVIDLSARGVIKHYSAQKENPFDAYVLEQRVFVTTPPSPTNAIIDHACAGEQVDPATGENRVIKVVLTEGRDVNGAVVLRATMSTSVGSRPSSETLVENLDRTVQSTTEKTYKGSNASGTFEMQMTYQTFPHTGRLSFTGSQISLAADLQCVPNW